MTTMNMLTFVYLCLYMYIYIGRERESPQQVFEWASLSRTQDATRLPEGVHPRKNPTTPLSQRSQFLIFQNPCPHPPF